MRKYDREYSFMINLKNYCLDRAEDQAHAFNILKANQHKIQEVHWLDIWQLINKKKY